MKIYLMIALALLCAAPASADEDCRLRQLGSLVIGFAANGDPTIPVTIAGKPYVFDLNIEHMHSAVTQKVVDAIGAKTEHIDFTVNFNNENTTKEATLPSIELGGAGGSDIKVLLVQKPMRSGSEGSLGLDIISQFDVEIDLAAGKLNLFSQKHCAGKVVYWGKPYDVIPFERGVMSDAHFNATLDGKDVSAGFATGAAIAQIGAADARVYLGISSDDPNLVPTPDQTSSDGPYMAYPFKTLTLGGISIANPHVVLFPQKGERCVSTKAAVDNRMNSLDPMLCLGPAPLMLGRNQMRGLHLYFAFSENNLYVTAADQAPPPTVP